MSTIQHSDNMRTRPLNEEELIEQCRDTGLITIGSYTQQLFLDLIHKDHKHATKKYYASLNMINYALNK